jgi:streptomycin 6-kinase
MVPDALRRHCEKTPERRAWLERLPEAVAGAVTHWGLTLEAPFRHEGEASWVRPVRLPDGTKAVLKLGMPHFEARDEAAGLRFWKGEPTVRLLDEFGGAMLLERCDPGTPLSERPETEQDEVLATLLPALWREAPDGFRSLDEMLECWTFENGADPGLVRELLASTPWTVLLFTDLHAGNVLAGARRAWIAIDPKPFVGDPAYDATQHLLNCPDRMATDPLALIARYAGLLGVDRERVRLWTRARLAVESRRDPRWVTAAARL